MNNMLTSLGVKRNISAITIAVASICRAIPGLECLVPILDQAAGLFGVTGVAHAAAASNISTKKLTSLAALVAALVAASAYIPALQPYVPLLERIAALLGALGIGITARK